MRSDAKDVGFEVDRLIAAMARCRADCMRLGLDVAAARLADAAKALKKARAEIPAVAAEPVVREPIAVVEDVPEGVPVSSRKRGRARRREKTLRDRSLEDST